ncbi:unnamed protein product [Ectocarpus sp. 8 AP-2014]
MDFRVATYNILCSHLAEPTRFPQCSPRNLDAPTRLKRVKHKLDAEISKGSVICLQEVGIQWAGDLHVYFMARGYAFVTAHYGKHFNNYMGEALVEHPSTHCSYERRRPVVGTLTAVYSRIPQGKSVATRPS